jgi:hypothetical protein
LCAKCVGVSVCICIDTAKELIKASRGGDKEKVILCVCACKCVSVRVCICIDTAKELIKAAQCGNKQSVVVHACLCMFMFQNCQGAD